VIKNSSRDGQGGFGQPNPPCFLRIELLMPNPAVQGTLRDKAAQRP
jgi:hypothetical protein